MNKVKKNDSRKTVIVGLDGATWNLLKPWAEENYLPNIKRLLELGAWGTISSTIPSVTGTAWTSFSTGRNPGSHGCLNFLIPTNSLLDSIPLDRNDIYGDNLFDILEKYKKRSIVINLPYTIPPKTEKGIYLADFLCIHPQQIFPESLKKEISEIKNYKTVISPEAVFNKGRSLVDEIINVASMRFKISKKLFKNYDWDCFFVMFGETDWLQHKKYGDLITGKEKLGSETTEAYKKLDSYIGWFLDNMPKETLFILLSDHGFGKAKWKLSINNWLQKKGYLKLRNISSDKIFSIPLGIRRFLTSKPKGFLGIILKFIFIILVNNPRLYLLFGQVSRLLMKKIPYLSRIIPDGVTTLGLEIDTKNTIACTIPGTASTIYINNKLRFKDGVVEEKDCLKIRKQLIEELKKLKDPDGNIAFKHVYAKEDIYKGECFNIAPDIILYEEDIQTSSDFGNGEIYSRLDESKGWHQDNGILALYYKNINKGFLGKVPIINLAPTILKYFNIPIPKSIEGKALKEVKNI